MDINHLLLIKKSICQLVVKEMCTKYWLPASERLPRNSVSGITDCRNITLAVDPGHKRLSQTIQQCTCIS